MQSCICTYGLFYVLIILLSYLLMNHLKKVSGSALFFSLNNKKYLSFWQDLSLFRGLQAITVGGILKKHSSEEVPLESSQLLSFGNISSRNYRLSFRE